MNKVNYQKSLDLIIHDIETNEKKVSLLLHSCCAPCSSYVLRYLAEYFHITLFYYNPNISPVEEYQARVQEQIRLMEALPVKNPISFLEGTYEPDRYYDLVRGHEKDPEGGQRCHLCYEMRLREAADIASKGGFDYFTTTLTISPLKDSGVLNQIGERLAKEYGVAHLPSDFKKKEGYKQSVELSKEYGLYRQDYCGCVFSKREGLE